MRGDDPALVERLESFLIGELVISAITLGELEHGWQAGFGAVMAGLSRPKRRTYDRQIAGHARSLGVPVVTSDQAGFWDIEGLIVESWTQNKEGFRSRAG